MADNDRERVSQLVERFARNQAEYRAGKYNETETRREFIDPLFAALGWDVDNRQGLPEAYKEVIHEDAINIGGAHKAPDYAFRVGGQRKFFVEAKKPSVNLALDPTPAFQLRRYAWSARLPVGVLTDFEEFAVYDGFERPDKHDSAAVARRSHITYDQYVDRWDELRALFSREAVMGGALERLAPKRGTTTVDAAFLKEIESWRELLARDIARHNAGLSQRELNYAVQMTIDRVIFLRMAEDRGIEQYGRLLALCNGGEVYARLRDLFRQADERYNSGLFHFHKEAGHVEGPDDLTPTLTLSDRALKTIFKSLYYPDSPYEFAVLPVEVLGQVYEQFLGKVIQLRDSQVEIEEKPEVRKAGGVYYTPKYIVEYIVRQTVGQLLAGKTPRQADALKIVDPACGSGSFLLGTYTHLLDWRRDWYVADGPEKHPKELYQAMGGEWRLTTAERKRVLLANIHGVDIDPQAVEVTKLSLLLKLLEGESEQTVARQLQFAYKERVLPDLGANITCGNSLIGPDFYDNQNHQMSLLPQEDHYRINVFDWRTGFPQVFKGANPGFDAVIGNPPYIRIQALKEWAPIEVEHYKRAYRAASKGNYDIYVVFVERGLQLLNNHGLLGYILPHKFFNAQYGEPLRGLLAEGQSVREIVYFGDAQVFAGASTYTALLFLSRAGNDVVNLYPVKDLESWRMTYRANGGEIPSSTLTAKEWNLALGGAATLLARLTDGRKRLGDIATRMYQGPITSADPIYLFKDRRAGRTSGMAEVFSQANNEWVGIEAEVLKPVVRSGSVGRYDATPTAWALFPYAVVDEVARLYSQPEMSETYPCAWEYLQRHREALRGREKGKFADERWFRYGRTQNLGLWERPKLMVPYMVTRLAAFVDRSSNYYFINVTTGGYGVEIGQSNGALEYFSGLMNSRLLDFYLRNVSTTFRGGYMAANKQYIEQLPIRTIDFTNPADVARHDELAGLVERMLALHAQRAAARTNFDVTVLERQSAATDRQIDQLVYALYELTADEVRIVEGVEGTGTGYPRTVGEQGTVG